MRSPALRPGPLTALLGSRPTPKHPAPERETAPRGMPGAHPQGAVKERPGLILGGGVGVAAATRPAPAARTDRDSTMPRIFQQCAPADDIEAEGERVKDRIEAAMVTASLNANHDAEGGAAAAMDLLCAFVRLAARHGADPDRALEASWPHAKAAVEAFWPDEVRGKLQ